MLPIIPLGLFAAMSAYSPDVLAEIRKRMVGNTEVTEHVDENDSPCGTRDWRTGCYQWQDGGHHVWYSDISPQYVIDHELSHAQGMLHTAWERDKMLNEACAYVIIPQGDYQMHDKICNNGKRELKFRGMFDNEGWKPRKE